VLRAVLAMSMRLLCWGGKAVGGFCFRTTNDITKYIDTYVSVLQIVVCSVW